MYNDWMAKAFVHVEGALGQELVTPGRIFMTEDYFRSALMRGLMNSKPELSTSVKPELSADWSSNECAFCGRKRGKGRPLQHDVGVVSEADPGMILEAKWIKAPAAKMIVQDLWKLILSRGTDKESNAPRCYLLIGGEAKALSKTFDQLRNSGLDLRWSKAGPGKTRNKQELNVDELLKTEIGLAALQELIGWGKTNHHYRILPPVWKKMFITRRTDSWVKTIDGVGWRAMLYDIHHHGADNTHEQIIWNAKPYYFTARCLQKAKPAR